MPTLALYMTLRPFTIAPDASMADAHRLMRKHAIRHLPVVDDNRLVGLVSLHDLYLLETLPGVVPEDVKVEDAMTTDVYTASAQDELEGAVEHMAQNKLGCVVITNNHGVEGIFTSIDALRVLADVLRREAA